MDSRQLNSLTEAYLAVYNEDLREDLFEEEEDFSFMDDLSDNELVYIMEQILLEGTYTLGECLDVFEGEYLFESAARERRAAQAGQKRKEAIQKMTRPARAMGRLAMGRLKKAATKAGENIKAGVESAKKYGSEKVASAKKKIGGLIDKARGAASRAAVDASAAPGIAKRAAGKVGARLVHKAAEAGRGAALKAANKLGRVAHSAHERGGSESLRKTIRGGGSSTAPAKPASSVKDTTHSGGGVGRREAASSGGIRSRSGSLGSAGSQGRSLSGSSIKGHLPSSTSSPASARRSAATMKLQKSEKGSVARGTRIVGPKAGQASSQRAHTGVRDAAAKFAKKAGLSEEFIYLLEWIMEDLIQEGYAYNSDDALELMESFSDYELNDLVESYLEEDDTYDVYDLVIEHLIDEGYADTFEDAEAIMVNMSEDWREEIVEVTGGGKVDYKPTFRGPSGRPGGRILPPKNQNPQHRGMSSYPGHKTADKITQLNYEKSKTPKGSPEREKLEKRVSSLQTRFDRDGKEHQDYV